MHFTPATMEHAVFDFGRPGGVVPPGKAVWRGVDVKMPARILLTVESVSLYPRLIGNRFRSFRDGLLRHSTSIFALALIAACDDSSVSREGIDPATGRWYTVQLAAAGAPVFADHCAECHGDAAQGMVDDWRERLPDGSFPPPPLNGSAHAWHHSLSVLLQVIDQGGIPLGGQMPAFEDVLAEEEELAAIAWFQEFWSDEIYGQWLVMGGVD